MDGWQRRQAPSKVDMRSGDSGGYTIVGHASVFGSLSENLGGFREVIQSGAFTLVLSKRPDVRTLVNHDPNLLLAGTRNGTLDLSQDMTGLAYRARVSPSIAETYYGQAMRAQLADGLVTQSSFAFRVAAGGDSWDEDPDSGGLIRTIREFSALYDVSAVTFPAYPAADSGLASSRRASSDHWRLAAVKRRIALREEFMQSGRQSNAR
jgi:HK97 family phage prohead protease